MAMKWRKAPEAVVRKFETIVPPDPRVERRKMFGYPAAFVGSNLFMSLHQESLILRLSEGDRAEFLKLPGASLFEPMPGRPMREYVAVPEPILRQDAALAGWIRRSLGYATSLPAKGARARGAPAAAAGRKAPRQGRPPAGAGASAKRRGAKARR
jgi:TfoX/Sxy family transcriptional regulator of competence genes